MLCRTGNRLIKANGCKLWFIEMCNKKSMKKERQGNELTERGKGSNERKRVVEKRTKKRKGEMQEERLMEM